MPNSPALTPPPLRDDRDELSLCSICAGGISFGIDTRRIREVLGKAEVQQVPLAPRYLGGIVPYRGEVLTAVDLRALLGLPPSTSASSVLVLDDVHEDGRFGLIVDRVGGVVVVDRRTHAANPTTLDGASDAIFDGAYRLANGLLIHLDPARLSPSYLRGSPHHEQTQAGEAASRAGIEQSREPHDEADEIKEKPCTL